ncbi:hypothetical protein B7P33_05230 [Sediminicola luteus]|uniref:RNA polymerase subunit sigma-24 n=2 Tax=Sediminicola luteus TaxID=319238 RepID=A0A2A4GF98_9FLAO|nr:hypothetical protein B7P33_05230 [Sediminicola luteus]
MVAVLVQIFGNAHLNLAEDVVQEALISALETWKYKGMPDNPKAWLYRAAKNKAIDILRKEKRVHAFDFSDPERQLLDSGYTMKNTVERYWETDKIQDDFLGMMYACCHPKLSEANQMTFILKTLCGFSTKEIARAFLTTEETISKRLFRSKSYFRKSEKAPKIPSAKNLGQRTHTVLQTIYLIYNEGYQSTHHKVAIRKDLIGQALYLCKTLIDHPKTQLPEAYALMALMCFHTARFPARTDAQGHPVLLQDQDRSLWDREMIEMGRHFIHRSAPKGEVSHFNIEAAIAHEHCIAATYEATNWKNIRVLYDALLQNGYDPILFLNRAVVIMEIEGPEKALVELQSKDLGKDLGKYPLYHIILGDLYQKTGQTQQARASFELALNHSQSESEKLFIQKKNANL